jgi:hypothetical protein
MIDCSGITESPELEVLSQSVAASDGGRSWRTGSLAQYIPRTSHLLHHHSYAPLLPHNTHHTTPPSYHQSIFPCIAKARTTLLTLPILL